MLIKIFLLIWTLLNALTRAYTVDNKAYQENAINKVSPEPINSIVRGSSDLPEEDHGAVWLPIFTEGNKSETLTRQHLTEFFMPETESQSLNQNEVFHVDSSNKNNFVMYKKVAFIDEDKSRQLELSEDEDSHKKFPYTKKNLNSRQDNSWTSKQEPARNRQPYSLRKEKMNNITKTRISIFARAPKFRLNNSGSKYKSNPNTMFKKNCTRKSKQAVFNYLNKKEPEEVILDSTDYQTKATEQPNEDNLQTNQPYDDHQTNNEIAELAIENGTKNESDTVDYEIPNDFHNDYLNSDVITLDGPLETPNAKSIQKVYNINGTDNKLMKLLDSVQKEIENIRINGSEKEIVKAKIKKIFVTVVGINLTTTSKENVEISSVHNKHRTQFPLKSGLSEGEFEIKQRIEDEENELFSIKSDELLKYEKMGPTYQYRYNTDIANSKTSENSTPFKEIEHPKVFVGVPWRHVTHKLYNSDKISGLKGKKPKVRDDEDFQRDYGYKKKLNSFITNNYRLSNKYTKYDTDLDYGEDPLDYERRKFYHEKIEELEKRHQIPFQTNQRPNNSMENMMSNRQHPEDMRERMRALEESRALASRYYENYRARFIQGY